MCGSGTSRVLGRDSLQHRIASPMPIQAKPKSILNSVTETEGLAIHKHKEQLLGFLSIGPRSAFVQSLSAPTTTQHVPHSFEPRTEPHARDAPA